MQRAASLVTYEQQGVIEGHGGLRKGGVSKRAAKCIYYLKPMREPMALAMHKQDKVQIKTEPKLNIIRYIFYQASQNVQKL